MALWRPPMRRAEARKVEASLKRHKEIMDRLVTEGWDHEAASKEALRLLKESR